MSLSPVTFDPSNAPARAPLRRVCEQLALYWSRFGQLPLLAADDGHAAASNLWSVPLPRRDHRAALAASLTIGATVPQAGYEIETRTAVVVHARGDTLDAAMELLTDLRRLVRPGERPLVYVPAVPTSAGVPLRGCLGLPEGEPQWDDGSTLDVWRVLAIDLVAEPQPGSLADFVGSGPRDGQADATMTLGVTMTPATLTAPTTWLQIWNTVHAYAAVEVTPDGLLRLLAGTTANTAISRGIDLELVGSISELEQEIEQDGWQVLIDPGFELLTDATPASRIEWRRISSGHTSQAAAAGLRVWAA